LHGTAGSITINTDHGDKFSGTSAPLQPTHGVVVQDASAFGSLVGNLCIPVRSYFVVVHHDAQFSVPVALDMDDLANTSLLVSLTLSGDTPGTLNMAAADEQGALLQLDLQAVGSPANGSWTLQGTLPVGYHLTNLGYTLNVPAGVLGTVQVDALRLTAVRASVPEPGTAALLGLGLVAGLACLRRRPRA
jgi:hypothetical protein